MKHLKSSFVLSLLLAVLFSLGCMKKPRVRADNYDEITGEYDYQYSENGEIYSDFSTVGNYGIKIKENGKVQFFKDGKLIEKGILSKEYSSSSGTEVLVLIMQKNGTYHFSISGDVMTVQEFPLDHYNYFKRK